MLLAADVPPEPQNFVFLILSALLNHWIYVSTLTSGAIGGLWCGRRRRSRGDQSKSFLADASNAMSAWLLAVMAIASLAYAIGLKALFEVAMRDGGLILFFGLGYSAYLCFQNVMQSANGEERT